MLQNKDKTNTRNELMSLSAQFYTCIPHNFGYQKMINFIIDTQDKLNQKLDLISNLQDMKSVFNKKTESNKGKVEVKNPLDDNYEALQCEIVRLAQDHKEF